MVWVTVDRTNITRSRRVQQTWELNPFIGNFWNPSPTLGRWVVPPTHHPNPLSSHTCPPPLPHAICAHTLCVLVHIHVRVRQFTRHETPHAHTPYARILWDRSLFISELYGHTAVAYNHNIVVHGGKLGDHLNLMTWVLDTRMYPEPLLPTGCSDYGGVCQQFCNLSLDQYLRWYCGNQFLPLVLASRPSSLRCPPTLLNLRPK